MRPRKNSKKNSISLTYLIHQKRILIETLAKNNKYHTYQINLAYEIDYKSIIIIA